MGTKAVNTVGDRIPQLPLLELRAATIAVSELPADQYGGCWQNLESSERHKVVWLGRSPNLEGVVNGFLKNHPMLFQSVEMQIPI